MWLCHILGLNTSEGDKREGRCTVHLPVWLLCTLEVLLPSPTCLGLHVCVWEQGTIALSENSAPPLLRPPGSVLTATISERLCGGRGEAASGDGRCPDWGLSTADYPRLDFPLIGFSPGINCFLFKYECHLGFLSSMRALATTGGS